MLKQVNPIDHNFQTLLDHISLSYQKKAILHAYLISIVSLAYKIV